MNKFLIILIALSFGLTQDEYPNFSDPLKQLAFEEKRIYVKEESGERTKTFGGGSKLTLANPLYGLYGESPHFISKSNPTFSNIEYWYNFEIKQNNIILDELSFLEIIGLKDKANQILDAYKEADSYNRKVYKEIANR